MIFAHFSPILAHRATFEYKILKLLKFLKMSNCCNITLKIKILITKYKKSESATITHYCQKYSGSIRINFKIHVYTLPMDNFNKINKIAISITLLLFLLFSYGILCQIYVEKTCIIYDNSLRFHIRADSDKKEDQKQKLIVRDAVLRYVKNDIDKANSAEEMKQYLAAKTAQIAQVAANAAGGKPVQVYFTQERFPIRHYGAAIFPAGVYEALRVDIGKARGHNWWCAFYPKLCYIPEEKITLPKFFC